MWVWLCPLPHFRLPIAVYTFDVALSSTLTFNATWLVSPKKTTFLLMTSLSICCDILVTSVKTSFKLLIVFSSRSCAFFDCFCWNWWQILALFQRYFLFRIFASWSVCLHRPTCWKNARKSDKQIGLAAIKFVFTQRDSSSTCWSSWSWPDVWPPFITRRCSRFKTEQPTTPSSFWTWSWPI